MAKSFRELKVWRKATDLATAIYKLTAGFPKSEVYELSSQMGRAAVSIASNIAEGSARVTRKNCNQFVTVARGSNNELQTQLVIAERLNYASAPEISDVETLSHEIGQMLSGLSKYLSTPKST